ncbi:hypothetical protein [Piscinibacter sp. XHJ-5]|uniref:hypothetical protein n=1 Tax=Piscinibacter sp. XHJ-5 TaxID=3037797 RepID=UPI00245300BC|nr:hypothetical protein [Piscinibacter sp. XHJ-5]
MNENGFERQPSRKETREPAAIGRAEAARPGLSLLDAILYRAVSAIVAAAAVVLALVKLDGESLAWALFAVPMAFISWCLYIGTGGKR